VFKRSHALLFACIASLAASACTKSFEAKLLPRSSLADTSYAPQPVALKVVLPDGSWQSINKTASHADGATKNHIDVASKKSEEIEVFITLHTVADGEGVANAAYDQHIFGLKGPVSQIEEAADRSGASFTFEESGGKMRKGKVSYRPIPSDRPLYFIAVYGQWPAGLDAAVRKDFDAIVAGVSLAQH